MLCHSSIAVEMENNVKVNFNSFVFLLIFSGIFTLINSSIVHINGEYFFSKISSFNCLTKRFVILSEICGISCNFVECF